MNFLDKQNDYANLLITKGINVQNGQPLVINAPVEAKEFVELCVQKAYENGAGFVYVNWINPNLTKLKIENADDEYIDQFPQYEIDRLKFYREKKAGFLSLIGEDPELFKNVDSERFQRNIKASSLATKDHAAAIMKDENPWCVASYPTKEWATAVYPDLEPEESVEKLWENIFYTCRIDENTIQNWDNHIQTMKNNADRLNELNLTSLHYTSSNGTDLTIRLPEGHIWVAADSVTPDGIQFIANIPTEEVFTMPHKDGVDGIVYNTKPLNYNGNTIDHFYLRFENGKVVDYDAKIGRDVLSNILQMDEGSIRLGEVALVPYDSPISNLNLLFLETLFDENASCHLALGKAYPTNIKNGEKVSKEELTAMGVNDSLVHEDFMVGSKDLKIDGYDTAGIKYNIFEEGNWANHFAK